MRHKCYNLRQIERLWGAYEIFTSLVDRINYDGNNIKVGNLEEEYNITAKPINGAFNRKVGQSVKSGPEELNLIYIGKEVTYTKTVSADVAVGDPYSYYSVAKYFKDVDENKFIPTSANVDLLRWGLDNNNDFVLKDENWNPISIKEYLSNDTGK